MDKSGSNQRRKNMEIKNIFLYLHLYHNISFCMKTIVFSYNQERLE